MSDYAIVRADEVEDAYAGSEVPGEFRSLKDALGAQQVAVTLIRVPPHSDFEQGSGHFHEEVAAGSAVRVAPGTTRSHRNEGDATKVEDFWEPSASASQ